MFRTIFSRAALATVSVLFSPIYCITQKQRSIYIWGNGNYIAKSNSILQFHNYCPKKITNLPKDLVVVEFGEHFDGGINTKGQFYVWEKHVVDSNFQDIERDYRRQGIKALGKNIKDVKFTSGCIWGLANDGKVYQWEIKLTLNPKTQIIDKKIGDKREIESLRGCVKIAAGRDHLITLNREGQIYAVGDDTYGQCGYKEDGRNTFAPFAQRRIVTPVKNGSEQIVQISANNNHNLALDKHGNLFGWGSNSSLQISHESEFSKMSNPLLCSFVPIKISKGLEDVKISHIATGHEFSIVVGQSHIGNNCEAFAFGNNLHGQLGIGEQKNFRDVTKIEKISNYTMKVKGQNTKVKVDQLQCGKNHCIALLNVGYVMEWGHNELGQLGNEKRSASFSPVIVKHFSGKKVVSVFAGQNNSGAIVEQE